MLLHFYDENIYIHVTCFLLKDLHNFSVHLFQTYHDKILFFIIVLNLIK